MTPIVEFVVVTKGRQRGRLGKVVGGTTANGFEELTLKLGPDGPYKVVKATWTRPATDAEIGGRV